jgi:uncharacterized protein involved in exopolysaccharide biosynthesis
MLRLAILRILESYFRHRWLYLLPIVFLTALGGVYIAALSPEYQASGVVFVQRETLLSSLSGVAPDGFAWVTASDASASELNELLQTDSFIRAVILQTDLEEDMDMGREAVEETIDMVRKSISVRSIGSNQMQISASHEDANVVFQLVNSVVENHIQWQTNASMNDSLSAQEFFAELIQKYSLDLENAQRELDDYLITHPEPIRGDRTEIEVLAISRLQSQVDLATSRLSSALNKEEDARLALSQVESNIRQTYFLVDAPTIPEDTETSKVELAATLVIFMVAGGIFSAVSVVGGTLLDRTFRFPYDVEHILELPVLTEIAAPVKPRRKLRKSRKVAAEQPSLSVNEDSAIEFKDQVAI